MKSVHRADVKSAALNGRGRGRHPDRCFLARHPSHHRSAKQPLHRTTVRSICYREVHNVCWSTLNVFRKVAAVVVATTRSSPCAVAGRAAHKGCGRCRPVPVHQTSGRWALRVVPLARPPTLLSQQPPKLCMHLSSSRLSPTTTVTMSHPLPFLPTVVLPVLLQHSKSRASGMVQSITVPLGWYLCQRQQRQALHATQHQVSLSMNPATRLSQVCRMHRGLSAVPNSRSRSLNVQPISLISMARSPSRAGHQAFHVQQRVQLGPPPMHGVLQSACLGPLAVESQLSCCQIPTRQLSSHLRGFGGTPRAISRIL